MQDLATVSTLTKPAATLPDTSGFSFPGIGTSIPLNVPWAGGSPVEGVTVAIMNFIFPFLRAFLSIVLIVALWCAVFEDAKKNIWLVFGVEQIKLQKLQVLGTSIGLAAAIPMAAVLLGVIVAVPSTYLAVMNAGIVNSVGTLWGAASQVVDTVSGETGVWGLVQLVFPWDIGMSVVIAWATWWVTSNFVASCVGLTIKAWLTD